jgi:hypothetical protein
MTYEEFINNFKPITNNITNNAPYGGYMFETFGAELDFVKQHKNKNIWTIMDDDSILAGYHIVNRMGYIICEVDNHDMDMEITDFDEEI